MKRRLAAVLAAVALVVGLTACSPSGPAEEPTTEYADLDDRLRVAEVELPDGRTVVCVALMRVKAGGLSCDWSRARAES